MSDDNIVVEAKVYNVLYLNQLYMTLVCLNKCSKINKSNN